MAVSILAISAVGASAADMAVKAPPVAIDAGYNWSGWYVGVNAGGMWRDDNLDPGAFDSTGFVNFAGRQAVGQFPSYRFRETAFIGGGQIGYNWQSASFVYGLEADFQYTSHDSTQTFLFPVTGGFNANTESGHQRLDFLGTVRGRLGYTFAPRFLGYVTGGLAYGQVQNSVTSIGVPNGFAGVAVSTSSTEWKTGWTAGAGFEYAFTNNWSVKGEYLYYDLGSQNLVLNYAVLPGGAGNLINYRANTTGNIARVGLNYKWGSAVVARY